MKDVMLELFLKLKAYIYRYLTKLFKMVDKKYAIIDRLFTYFIIHTDFAFPTFSFETGVF